MTETAPETPTTEASEPGDLIDLIDLVDVIGLLGRSTTRLLTTVSNLTADEVHAPSTLPGWSRGHLLTHLANNAEGLTRLILSAQSGMRLPMYSSVEARSGDIAAGATRPAAIIVAHVRLATETLDAAIATVSNWATPVVFHTVDGPVEKPLADIVGMRLREVAIHHVDLAAGHDFGDEDLDVLSELTRDAARRFSPTSDRNIDLFIDGTPVACITTTAERSSPEPSAIVDLPGGAMLGWLTGRHPPRPGLPPIPSWG